MLDLPNTRLSTATKTTCDEIVSRKKLLVKEINTYLRQDLKIKISLGIDRNSLFIQYTFARKQKKISPHSIGLSTTGIHAARDLAIKIDNAIKLGLYSDDWLNRVVYGIVKEVEKPLTVGTIKAEFNDRWLVTRKGDLTSTDRQKLVTLENYGFAINKMWRLSEAKNSEIFDDTLIKRILIHYGTNTDARHRALQVIGIICKLWDMKTSVNIATKQLKPSVKRIILSDGVIVRNFEKMGDVSFVNQNHVELSLYYQWVYGVLATYGLRPQEIFAIDWERSFNPDLDNWLFLDGSLCEGIKTGDRQVPPLLPDWVNLFDLKTKPIIPSASKLQHQVRKIATRFRGRKLGKPYDLRHAYGLRSKQFMSPVDAANAMGHSLAVHLKVYHSHESVDAKIASVRNGMQQRGYK
jgi:integrase